MTTGHEMSLDDNAATWSRTRRTSRRRASSPTQSSTRKTTSSGVYIYPDEDGGHDAHVRSWVRADRAHLDIVVRQTVMGWLRAEWPFADIEYAGVDA